MSTNFEVELDFKGEYLIVKGTIEEAEPEVGIMNNYLGHYDVFNISGKPHDLDLTSSEKDQLDKAIIKALR